MDINTTSNQAPTPPTPSSVSNNTIMGILAYIGILVVIPLVSEYKNDPFVKFHAKQGLVLFICEIIGWFIFAIPFFGWMLAPIIEIAFLVMVILGIVNVVNHQMKELPLIGHLASNFKF